MRSLVLASPCGVPAPPPGVAEAPVEALTARSTATGSRRWLYGMALSRWAAGWTPQGFVRGLGQLAGGWLVTNYCDKRFAPDGVDKERLAKYMHESFFLPPGSENVLQALLLPGAWARRPLCERVPALSPGISVSFIYGRRDWMDIAAAHDIKTASDALDAAALEASGGRGGAAAARQGPRIHVAPPLAKAGHQVFLDDPEGFTRECLAACR